MAPELYYAWSVSRHLRIDWHTDVGHLAAIEPYASELASHAGALATAYNDPRNAELMGHSEPISPADVIEHYRELAAAGARQFLLLRDGELMGDADLRGLRDGAAEFAFMIGSPAAQGKGLGTRYALMVAACGFRELGLRRIFASVVPHNTASRRVFEKLGYVVDDSPLARGYADEPGDIVLALDRATLETTRSADLAAIAVRARP